MFWHSFDTLPKGGHINRHASVQTNTFVETPSRPCIVVCSLSRSYPIVVLALELRERGLIYWGMNERKTDDEQVNGTRSVRKPLAGTVPGGATSSWDETNVAVTRPACSTSSMILVGCLFGNNS